MRRTLRCASTSVLIAVFLAAGTAGADVVRQHYEFPEPEIVPVGDYHRVTMDGAWSYGDPGQPVLPMVGARILLPPGEEVAGVRVITGERVIIGRGLMIEPGQRQYPLSFEGPIDRIEADYEGMDVYPEVKHGDPAFGYFRGHGIASFALFPVEYSPKDGLISYYKSMDVEIETSPSAQGLAASERMIRHDDATISRIDRLVDNPKTRSAYSAMHRADHISRSLDPGLAYKYIIITTDSWDDYLGDLVAFETQRGHKAGVFLRSWIEANYTGDDSQEQIRNFIIDAYDTWDIDYVLLVGDARDDNGIPHRGMWNDAYGESEYDIPADIYYAGLDGNWNTDGDTRWGEYSPEEADLYPELGIGRFAVDSAEEVQNMVTKTLLYAGSPIVSECDEALMVGELLWSSPLTYGGDYKDQVMYGSSANSYTTVGFPGSMNVGTLYDRDVGDWSKTTLINTMETGLNIVNHLGHCNTQYSMKMTNSDIPSFDNDGTNHTLNFVYSQGCYNGAFDDRDPYGYVGDCFAEEFTSDDDGAVAVVMNSRYGWGDPGGTNGSSQFFDREFFDAMFGDEIYPLGDVNNDSKMDVIWALSYGANRWCYYELNLFGDPAMHLWSAEPTALTVTHPGGIIIGQPDMDVTVTDGGSPVVGAQVTIWTDDYSVYDTGVTGGSGMVTVHPSATTVGDLHIKVVAHDYLDYDADISINPASGPYVAFQSHVIDDDQSDESNGNGDGIANAGETIELVVTLENVGVETAYDVVATLSSTSSRVLFSDDYEEYGDIPASETATCVDDYVFTIGGDVTDGEVIPFTLAVGDSGRIIDDDFPGSRSNAWESNFSIQVSAPVVAYDSHDVDDPLYGGNGSGCVEAGETIVITVSLANSGSADASGVVATLSSADPYVTINEDTAEIPALGSGGSAALAPDYSVTILHTCPEFHEIEFDLDIGADWGYVSSGQFTVLTAGGEFSDAVETGVGEWVHSNVTAGFEDEWHIDTYRSNSSSHSWKFGGSGSSDYSNSSDGALYMRPMCIGTEGELRFWSWMQAEEESSTSAWDCGLVQISIDGGLTWDVLVPNGGYSHQKNYNPANPLPEGTPCWSGSFTWREEVFDLSSYAGETIQIRFRFASDGYVTEEGWYIDDINLTFDAGTSWVDDDPTLAVTFGLDQNAPNPFNPVTVISYQIPEPSHVIIDVFNLAGKRVKTIVDGHEEAGRKTVTWDGTNELGQKVASGVYMYRMRAGDYTSKKTMVLLK